jgi:NagD protein
MMDLDGTIYEGDALYPTSLPFFDALSRRGIAWGFVTNNTSRSIDSYVARLRGMGIPVSGREQVVTPVLSVADALRSEYPAFRRLFLLGTEDFRLEMQAPGFEETADSPDDRPDAVITAFDKSLNYDRLCRAAWWIRNGVPWFATHPDVFCPTTDRTWLVDCGAITACLETATGVRCGRVFGKPNPDLLQVMMKRLGLRPSELLMAGDREHTDIESGIRAGARTLRITSGVGGGTTETRADYRAPDLGAFHRALFPEDFA